MSHEHDTQDQSGVTDPNKAVDFMILNSKSFAQAKAQRVYLEEFRKSKKALLMNQCTEKAWAAKEAFAYSHPEYLELLEGIREAVRFEEALRWRLTGSQLRVEVWRSQNANNRTQDRTMR